MNWAAIPDMAGVALLAWAFAMVARYSQSSQTKFWLFGWLSIVLYFIAVIFLPLPGGGESITYIFARCALASAGIFFIRASVLHREDGSAQLFLGSLMGVYVLYIALSATTPHIDWLLNVAASLFGLVPLVIAFRAGRRLNLPARWIIVVIYCLLSLYLLIAQRRSADGEALAQAGIFSAIFICCSISFWSAWGRSSAGAFITALGFLGWGAGFLIATFIQVFWPKIRIESEIWNLPSYSVAVGMILFLLEDQILAKGKMVKQLEHMALHDSLTGLANRTQFESRLASAFEDSRHGNGAVALLVVDLDRFKHINDTMGHHAGDSVLREAGVRFLKCVRPSDTVARTGGDEFSIVLAYPTCREDAARVAECLKQSLFDPMQIGGMEVVVGASVGVAIFPDDAKDVDSMCVVADSRMYVDKQGSAKRLLTNDHSQLTADD